MELQRGAFPIQSFESKRYKICGDYASYMVLADQRIIGTILISLIAVVITADSCVSIAFAQIYANRTLHSAVPLVVPSHHVYNVKVSPQTSQGRPVINSTAPRLNGPSTVIASPVTDESENATGTNTTTTAGSGGTFSGTR